MPENSVSPTTIASVSVVIDMVAKRLAGVLLKSERVPKDSYLQQLRRSISCGKAMPIHMLLAVSLDEAEALEVPIGHVVEPYLQIVEFLQARRRAKLEGLTGSTHAIAAPSLLREIKREDRYEHDENQAESDVLADESDAVALQKLLDRSAAEIHEQLRRDTSVRARLMQALLREECPA